MKFVHTVERAAAQNETCVILGNLVATENTKEGQYIALLPIDNTEPVKWQSLLGSVGVSRFQKKTATTLAYVDRALLSNLSKKQRKHTVVGVYAAARWLSENHQQGVLFIGEAEPGKGTWLVDRLEKTRQEIAVESVELFDEELEDLIRTDVARPGANVLIAEPLTVVLPGCNDVKSEPWLNADGCTLSRTLPSRARDTDSAIYKISLLSLAVSATATAGFYYSALALRDENEQEYTQLSQRIGSMTRDAVLKLSSQQQYLEQQQQERIYYAKVHNAIARITHIPSIEISQVEVLSPHKAAASDVDFSVTFTLSTGEVSLIEDGETISKIVSESVGWAMAMVLNKPSKVGGWRVGVKLQDSEGGAE